MKKRVLFIIFFLILLVGYPSLSASTENIKIAVFPFDIFSQESLSYLRYGLQDMLSDKLREEGIIILTPNFTNHFLKSSNVTLDSIQLVREVAGHLGVDYAIVGSFTKISNRISFSLKIIDIKNVRRTQLINISEEIGIDDLNKLMEKLVREISIKLARHLDKYSQISNLIVIGNCRIETEAIKAILESKIGEYFSLVSLDEDLRAIWNMGYFDDVRIENFDSLYGRVILVWIVEKSIIREIYITGNKAIDDSDLREQIGVKVFSIFRAEALLEAENKIIKKYKDKGYYDIKITINLESLEFNDKRIYIKINEGAKIFIKNIEFIGNLFFSASDLRDQMSTKGRGWLSWFTEDNVLETGSLEHDLDKIRDIYYNNGYLQAMVAEQEIRREENGLVIVINIVEGVRFKINDIQIEGDIIKSKEEVILAISSKVGEWFSNEVLRRDYSYLVGLYADQGYAYVEVIPHVKQNLENHSVSISFFIKKGEKIYLGSIIISGNIATRDKVIRREINLSEGDLYSATALREANMRLVRLEYFEEVQIYPNKGSSSNRMDIKVDVKEKRTGNFSVGVGYTTLEQFIAMGRIVETNLWGNGQHFELKGYVSATGSFNRYIISFMEPWLFDRPISFGFDIYNWDREYYSFSKETLGGHLLFSWPTPWGYTRLYTHYTYEIANVYSIQDKAAEIIKSQEGEHITSSIRTSLRRDSRDHHFMTTQGSDHLLSIEYAGYPIGGTNAFIKVIAETGWYFPLYFFPWNNKHVFAVRARVGWLTTHSGGNLPIYEKFFLGGINTLRGFEYHAVSPLDPDSNDRVGGERMFMGNVEYRFPILSKAGFMGIFFFDAGNSWTKNDGYLFNDLRTSIGAGIRWYSPIGPLRLEYGYVLDSKPDESNYSWEFNIGAIF